MRPHKRARTPAPARTCARSRTRKRSSARTRPCSRVRPGDCLFRLAGPLDSWHAASPVQRNEQVMVVLQLLAEEIVSREKWLKELQRDLSKTREVSADATPQMRPQIRSES
eukprot:3731037-Pleurochrysis_carterae.AAC.2